jgi:hypothetical protein
MKETFKDLSLPLKIAIVVSYITLGMYAFAFLIGFVEGVLGI